ncbi:SNF1 protein kinase subunit beta-3 [Monosporozyma unispora]
MNNLTNNNNNSNINNSNEMLDDSSDQINDTLTQSFSQMNVDSPNELEPQLSRQHEQQINSYNNSSNSITQNNRSRSTLIFDDEEDEGPYYNENNGEDDVLSNTSSQFSEDSSISYSDEPTTPASQQQQQVQQQQVQQQQQQQQALLQQQAQQQQAQQTQKSSTNSTMVPVDIVWQQGGNKAYVTGSFTGWRKMIGLVPVPGKPGILHVKLQLPPGTHRFRFIVDNELRFSDFLPTATDQMGNFVNYLEVVAPTTTTPTTTTTSTNDQFVSNEGTTPATTEEATPENKKQKKTIPMSARSRIAMEIEQEPDDMGDGYTRYHDEALSKPDLEFTQDIPAVFTDPTVMEQYYLTLDQQQNNHQNMAWLTPPQLPPHLENVILNSYSNSQGENNENNSGALPIPNHVILNHLATSSIKHNTLCVASIVRYKQKYVTQILYAPLQ